MDDEFDEINFVQMRSLIWLRAMQLFGNLKPEMVKPETIQTHKSYNPFLSHG